MGPPRMSTRSRGLPVNSAECSGEPFKSFSEFSFDSADLRPSVRAGENANGVCDGRLPGGEGHNSASIGDWRATSLLETDAALDG